MKLRSTLLRGPQTPHKIDWLCKKIKYDNLDRIVNATTTEHPDVIIKQINDINEDGSYTVGKNISTIFI